MIGEMMRGFNSFFIDVKLKTNYFSKNALRNSAKYFTKNMDLIDNNN